MMAMDQFKDIGGFTRYASRLEVSAWDALGAWLLVAFDESLGYLLHRILGPRCIVESAVDPAIRSAWLGRGETPRPALPLGRAG
jgi:hypothetical protein